MKLQLDYDKKEIRLEKNVNLGEFVQKIKHILPDWKEWTIDTNVEIVFNSPTRIIERPYWYWQPYTTCSTSTDNTTSLNVSETLSEYRNKRVNIEM